MRRKNPEAAATSLSRTSRIDAGTAASSARTSSRDPLLVAEAILRGAESIHEWPFDDQMQRVAAIVMTGVVTGIVVRFLGFALGV